MKNRLDHEVRNWNTPTPNMVKERKAEDAAFMAYRRSEDVKNFLVRDAFGFSRYNTLAEAEAFSALLKGSEVISL